jgi:hypothetical protein
MLDSWLNCRQHSILSWERRHEYRHFLRQSLSLFLEMKYSRTHSLLHSNSIIMMLKSGWEGERASLKRIMTWFAFSTTRTREESKGYVGGWLTLICLLFYSLTWHETWGWSLTHSLFKKLNLERRRQHLLHDKLSWQNKGCLKGWRCLASESIWKSKVIALQIEDRHTRNTERDKIEKLSSPAHFTSKCPQITLCEYDVV